MASRNPAEGRSQDNVSLLLGLAAITERFGDGYIASVVRRALDSRGQVSDVARSALDAAIITSEVRVQGGGFRPQNVNRAPSYQLQAPVLHAMSRSGELVRAVLRIWAESQQELQELAVQRLQEMGQPTNGPDFAGGCFRGVWDLDTWESERNRISEEDSQVDSKDLELMLCYLSGKAPPILEHGKHESGIPSDESSMDGTGVDFARWQGMLRTAPPDVVQWEEARAFAVAVLEIADTKEQELRQASVNALNESIANVRGQFSEELDYLEWDISSWSAATTTDPAVAARGLELAEELSSIFVEYRPVREMAPIRSEEQSRAARRAELETEVLAALGRLQEFLSDIPAPHGGEETEQEADPHLTQQLGQATDPTSRQQSEREPAFGSVPTTDDGAIDASGGAPESRSAAEPDQGTHAGSDYNGQATALLGEAYAKLRVENDCLREELESLKADLHTSKNNEKGWHELYLAACKGPEAAGEDFLPTDVNEAVAQAEKNFPDELLFRLNSRSWTKNNPFNDPKAVLDALEWLATTYYRSRRGEISVPKLDDSLYEFCRWKYVGSQSEVTMGQFEDSYVTRVNGRPYRLEEHIGKGSDKDPVNTIRIAFHWDKERQQVIIGYIGQHQRTEAT